MDLRQKPVILIVDRQPLAAAGARALLEANGHEVGAVTGTLAEALALAKELLPAIAIVDDALPDARASAAVTALGELADPVAAIVHAGSAGRGSLAAALAAGARGVVLKSSPPEELLRAITAVQAGGIFVDESVVGESPGPLSPREQQVLELV